MKTISNIMDLRPYGIEPLTGEACGLMFRILCDVTERGRKLICKAYGLPSSTALAENWNHGVKDDPHVGSIMLDPDQFEQIGIFALLESNCRYVYKLGYRGIHPETLSKRLANLIIPMKNALATEREFIVLKEIVDSAQELVEQAGTYSPFSIGVLYGIELHDSSDDLERFHDFVRRGGFSLRRFSYQGNSVRGDRNVHQFSGRAE